MLMKKILNNISDDILTISINKKYIKMINDRLSYVSSFEKIVFKINEITVD